MADDYLLEPLEVADDQSYAGKEDVTFGDTADSNLSGGDGFFSFSTPSAEMIEKEKQDYLRRMGGQIPPKNDADDANDSTFGNDADTFGSDADTFGSDAETFGSWSSNDAPKTPTKSVPAATGQESGEAWNASPANNSIWTSPAGGQYLPFGGFNNRNAGLVTPSAFAKKGGSSPQKERVITETVLTSPAAASPTKETTLPSPSQPPLPENAYSLEQLEAQMAAGNAPHTQAQPPQAGYPQQVPPQGYPAQQQGAPQPYPQQPYPQQPYPPHQQQPYPPQSYHQQPQQPYPQQPYPQQGQQAPPQPQQPGQPQILRRPHPQQQQQEQAQYDMYISRIVQQRHADVIRKPYKKASQRMSAYELETIIKLQEQQLRNIQSNSYVGDYYYQNYYHKKFAKAKAEKRNPLDDLPPRMAPPLPFHLPICDAPAQTNNTSRGKRRGNDPLANALGRIPAHSVKAPRALLQISAENGDFDDEDELTEDGKQQQSLMKVCFPLVLIEDCYTCLIDLEDIDLILQTTSLNVLGQQSYHNIIRKRQNVAVVLCTVIGVNMTNRPDAIRDKSLLQIMQKPKGKKLMTRAIRSLPDLHLYQILMFVARFLGRIVVPHTEPASDYHSAYLASLLAVIARLPFANLTQLIELFSQSSNEKDIGATLNSTEGVAFLHTLLKSVSASLAPLQAQLQAPNPHPSIEQTIAAWRSIFGQFLAKTMPFYSALTLITDPKQDHTHGDCVWRLLGTIVSLSTPSETELLLQTLRESITMALKHDPSGAVRSLLNPS